MSKGSGRRRGGNPRTELERIIRHFDVSEEEAKKNYHEYKSELPDRGTGL